MTDEEKTRLMVSCWNKTGPALADIRIQEARAMTERQRIAAMLDVLSLPGNPKHNPDGLPEHESGLVAQQHFFSRSWK